MEKLVRRAKKGDKDAFVALMEENKHAMIAAARAILRNEDDVADALQDTVLAAFQKLCTLREEKYWKTWLMRILINSCYSILRGKKTVAIEEFLPEESREYNWDSVLDVKAALGEASPGDRLVLTLYYVQDMSVREIAAAIGASENAVKQRLSRSRKHFKNIYLKGAVVNE